MPNNQIAAKAFGLFFAALVLLALPLRAEQEIIKSHGISTFGELKYPADFTHLDYVNPNAPQGGEMSMAWIGSFDSMNPYSIKGRSDILASNAFESLLIGTADEIGASYGLLAQSIEYPKDRSWVIFTIRQIAQFSDGSPITAQDVEFSYQTFLTKGLSSFRVQLSKMVQSVEILSPRRIKFTFKADFPKRDVIDTVGGLPIFSKTDFVTTGRDFEDSFMEPMLGSGPYVLERVDVSKTTVYRKNPTYWGRDLPINTGQYNFERLRVEYYGDSTAAFEGFKGGTYLFRNENSSKIWATGYDFPAVKSGAVIKDPLVHGNKTSGQSFIFNLRREKFQDPRVREAISMMFNFTWSNETLFYGLYDRVTSFWGNSYLEATGKPSAAELAILQPLADILPSGVLDGEALAPIPSSKRQLDRKALRRASDLLDQAGWSVGSDGLRRDAKGQVLRVEFLNDSQSFDRVIDPYVANLKRLGIDALHTRIDSAQMKLRERPPHYDFDIITGHLQTSYIPGTGLRQYFGSESADNSAFNKMGLKSEAVDRLIDLVLEAKTQADLTVAVKALDRVLRAEKFWVPQWAKNVHTVAYFNLYEHPEKLPPYALGNLDFWWYNAEKAAALKASGAID